MHNLSKDKRLRRRPGMTMVELLGVMVVIGILGAIAIGGILSGTENARTTAVRTALQAYTDAFTNVSVYTPGIVNDRASNWPNSTEYTGKLSFHKTVQRMNELLDDKLDFAWDNDMKC